MERVQLLPKWLLIVCKCSELLQNTVMTLDSKVKVKCTSNLHYGLTRELLFHPLLKDVHIKPSATVCRGLRRFQITAIWNNGQTYLKLPLKKKIKNWFSKPIIA